MPARVAILAEQPFDRVVVRHQRRDLRLGDPLQQRLVLRVEVGAGGEDLPRVRVAVPLEDLGVVAGVQQEHVTRLDDDVVRGHDLPQRLEVDPTPFVSEVVREVDEHAPALHAVERHVLEAEVVREAAVAAAVAGGVVLRSDEVDPGAVPVVIDRLFDPVAVGVELGTDVGERVPLRRVLQREGHHVVGPHVDVLGIAVVLHLAHVDVVEDGGMAIHVLGGRERGRGPALVQGGSTGIVERQAQAEGDAGLDLAHALENLLGGDQIDATELVVLAPIAPRRAGRALCPPLRHGTFSFRRMNCFYHRASFACTDRLV